MEKKDKREREREREREKFVKWTEEYGEEG